MGDRGCRVSAAAFIVLCFALILGNVVVGIIHVDLQETHQRQQQRHHSNGSQAPEERAMLARRRRPFGPGSSPPTCRFRCGRCYPCIAVHVAIQPGVSRPLDYYPEAWRCRCGNKYFMP